MLRYRHLLLAVLVVALFSDCKKKEPKEDFSDIKGNYFPMNQFILDQWNNFTGAPFVIVKTIRVNGKTTDSSYTNSDTLNWGPIFETFSKTDISDRKYLGQYNFNQFDDPQDNTHNFFYMAKDNDLYTQKLLITLDQNSMKIKGIYVETYKKTALNEETQKLYYAPVLTIQIQTDVKPVMGSRTHTITEYNFLR